MKNLPQFVVETFGENFARLCMWVKGKFSVSQEDAEDIAMQSLMYACIPLMNGESANPASGADWLNMAKCKAGFLVKDGYRRHQRSKVVGHIDDLDVDDEGSLREEHKWVEQASYENWCMAQQDDERHDMGKVAMKVLPQIFEQMGTSQRDRRIYHAVALRDVPVEVVCAAFKVNKQQVYTIRNRVNSGLKKYGPAIVHAAFAA